jgi:hypothetical protein
MFTLDPHAHRRIDVQIAAMLRESNANARLIADTLRRERQMETTRSFALVLLIDWLVEKLKNTKA